MDDDRLASELQRRASGASPRPDWAQRDLLPAVWREIDARPQPVLASRWSPLAGLATLVVALLVLVVAVPRLVPQPPSATSTPADLLVMSSADFAARFAAGSLEGQTVLVDGSITADPARVGYCVPTHHCYFGVIDGTEPAVTVSVVDIATVAEDANASMRGLHSWTWWRAFRAPVEGNLLLSVDDGGSVDYLGRALVPSGGLTWSVGDAAALDVNSLSLDEIVLVDGWLTGYGEQIPCPHPSSGDSIEGLPLRICPYSAWLADDPVQPSRFDEQGVGLQVQAGGYYDYAPDPSAPGVQPVEPRRGIYAVARRLEGYCGASDPPCWQWTVVARVDAATELATPTPSSSVSSSPSGSPEPPPTALPCEGPGLLTSISDPTGLIAGCVKSEPRAIASLGPDLPAVTNPGGDLSRLRLAWLTSGCATSATVSIVPNSSPPLFLISAPPSCILSNALLIGIDLALSSPVDASTIGVRFDEPAPQPTPSQPVQPSEVRTIDCPDETTGAGPVQVEDHTGLVTGCSAGGAVAGDEAAVTSSSPSELAVKWMAPCVVDPLNTRIELWYREPKGDPSDPSRFQPPYLLVVNRSHPTEPYACLDAISGRQARIQLDQPISPADVALFFTYDGIGADSAQAGDGTNRFQLEIAADQPEYVEGESIAVTVSILSVADATVTGLVHPAFGVEQLDGVISLQPGPSILMCPRPIDLTGGVPLEESTPWPTSWSPDVPQAGFLDAYVRDGKLILPTGTYRFYALSSFSIGDTCTGDPVELEASIVVAVR